MSRKVHFFLIGIILILVLILGISCWKQADDAKIQREHCRQFFTNSLSEAELNYKEFCEKIEDEADISELVTFYNAIMHELTLANYQYVAGEKKGFIEENEYYQEEAIVELQRQIMKCFENYVAYVEGGRKDTNDANDFLSQYFMGEDDIEKIFQDLKLEEE